LSVAVHPADVQDRDGVALVLDQRTRALFPFIERIFADAGYQGPRVASAAANTGSWVVEIVKRYELHKFVVLPKRWIVERTLAWISRNRCRTRDFERYARTVAAFIRLAMIRIDQGNAFRPNLNFLDRPLRSIANCCDLHPTETQHLVKLTLLKSNLVRM
jgi:putative transposase